MKFVAFSSSTILFLLIIVTACAQDSQSLAGFQAGHYTGTALNTTANQRGNVVLDLYDLDASSGHVRAYCAFSEGLEGESWLNGRIDRNGNIHLTGSLAQFKMDVEGQLSSPSTIKFSYSLVGANQQRGNFEVSLQRPIDESATARTENLIGAWEIGGGMPMPRNPVTGMPSGISFVDARRLEILPDGEFTHLHSHEHCEGSGMARCCLQTAVLERGTLSLDGNEMIFKISGGDNISRDNCQPKLNHQGHETPKTETFTWTMRGSGGNQQLCLQGGSGNETTCYQRQT